MVVEVVLILAAELQKVVALQQRQIVAEEVVLAVPEAGADVLRVDVKGARTLVLVSPKGSSAPPSPENCGGAFSSLHDQKLRRKL